MVEHVGRLVHPAPLRLGFAVDLRQSLPEAQGAAAHRRLGATFKPRRLRSKSSSSQLCSLSSQPFKNLHHLLENLDVQSLVGLPGFLDKPFRARTFSKFAYSGF